MKNEYIKIRGAKEHNLKDVSLDIPRDKLVVLTGLSGSGKSSLAFDTIYAEGQRRYMESLSSYARMFLGHVEKPDVESIEGLSPAISIDQKSTNRNPRSTVGTVTEIYDYMRLLYARVGIPHCPKCGKAIHKQSIDQMVDRVMLLPEKTKFQILAPIVKGKKGRHEKVLASAKKSGYVRVIIDGNVYELSEDIELDKNKRHTIELVTDRIVFKEESISRIDEAVSNAVKNGEGNLIVNINNEDFKFSENFVCSNHPEVSFPEINPRLFSFNAPFGACSECNGLGSSLEVNLNSFIIDEEKSIEEGGIAIVGGASKTSWTWNILISFLKAMNIDITKKVKDLTKEEWNLI